MRRLFACLAAVGLLGGVIGCNCIHGRCDCHDEGYGCACCPSWAGGDHHGSGLEAPHMEGAPGYVSSGTVTTPSPSATAQK
jgi:hypothetical protein